MDVVDVAQARNVELRRHGLDEAHDLAGDLRVQRRRRLVEQQELRALHQRPGDPDPLALAARQLVGALVDVILQAHPVQQRQRAFDVGARKGAEQRAEVSRIPEAPGQHVVHDAHAVDEVELLEDHADVAAKGAQAAPAQRRHFTAMETDASATRLHELVDAADQRRLARAARADDGEEVVGLHVEGNAFQDLGSGRRVACTQLPHLENRHGRSFQRVRAAPPPRGDGAARRSSG